MALYPFEDTRSVAFELSNLCNLAWAHHLCPLNAQAVSPFAVRAPTILPADIVEDSITILAAHGWKGIVEFHQYNEPLMDPRLFVFVERARRILPDNPIEIVTNGYYLSVQLVYELKAQGVTKLHVSLYGSDEERKARAEWIESAIAPVLPTALGWHRLDDRLGIYERPETGCRQPCGAPVRNIVVTCQGHVSLCCFDWKRTVTFGDLRHVLLDEILASREVRETTQRLSTGARPFDVCRRCNTAMGV